MKLRQHRGGLAESLETVVEIPATLSALTQHIQAQFVKEGFVCPGTIRVHHYGFDERINWDTHIVIINRYGPYGYTDGPVEDDLTQEGTVMTDSFVCDTCGQIDSILTTPQDGPAYECHTCKHGRWHNHFQAETYKGPQDGPMLNRPGSDGLNTSFS